MAKKTRKSKGQTAQQRKLGNAAKRCKGSSDFRGCMRRELRK